MRAILEQFWIEDATEDAVQAVQLEGWLDVLEPFSDEEVRRAWAEYQRSGPRARNGALRKPDAGALWLIIDGWRGRAAAAQRDLERRRKEAEEAMRPRSDRVTAERAAEILREVAQGKTSPAKGMAE